MVIKEEREREMERGVEWRERGGVGYEYDDGVGIC